MARLASIADGNFTSSGTWAVCDSTSELDSEANNTALTTSYVASSAFTPGAITIDGIMVKVLNRAASPSGTMSVELYNSTLGASVSGTEVTINISDISAASVSGGTTPNGGWLYFKFGSSVLLLAATNYQVRAKTSASTQINLYRDATSNNWSRELVTTTTQAPAAGDNLIVIGSKTGGGTGSDVSVTMNETATTDYGKIDVCDRGTLTWGTSSSTNYYLKLSGNLNLYGGGTIQVGTTGTPIPSTSTAVIEFDCTTNVEFGMEIYGGTLTMQGASKTVKAMLAADAAASATSLTTDVSTGWKNGDEIALASTTRTASECEKKSLTADASGTTLTISAITNAHSGTSPTQGELANLTRNIKVRGISTTNQSYVRIRESATIDWDYAEFYNIGSGTSNKRGIQVDNSTTDGSGISIQYCSLHDFIVTSSRGFETTSNSPGASVNLNFSNNVTYNIHSEHLFVSTGSAAHTISDNLFIRGVATGATGIFTLSSFQTLTANNNTIVGSANTLASAVNLQASSGSHQTSGVIDGLTVHSNNDDAVGIYTGTLTISNLNVWRNNGDGVVIGIVSGGTSSGTITNRLIINGGTFFGNSAVNIRAIGGSRDIILNDCNIYAGTTHVATYGIYLGGSAGYYSRLHVNNSTFGSPTAHSGGDVYAGATSDIMGFEAYFNNCLFSSSTEWANVVAGFKPGSLIASQRHDQTDGNHKTQYYEGLITLDTTIYDTSPSQRLAPNSNSSTYYKLKSSTFRIPVEEGQTLTPSVKVRKSVSGDGAAYNGNQPRLIVKRNDAAGVSDDTILDTATSASDGAWETLTGTTVTAIDNGVLEFYVDCDGTAGWINVDTVTVT